MQPHPSWLLNERITTTLRRLISWCAEGRQRPLMLQPSFTPAGSAHAGLTPHDTRGPTPRWRDMMVFRKESRADSFQRQISALRQQLSTDQEDDEMYPVVDDASPMPGDSDAAPRPTTLRALSPLPEDAEQVGVIAANSHWNGTLRSEGSLRVLGTVEGELYAVDEIYIAEGASIHARVSAAQVVIAGTVNGTVECTNRLEILPAGHVIGDVTSPILIVHEGATVEGDLSMRAPEARPA
jgi:cytoskeletal protein CcmA (bactofilin family)